MQPASSALRGCITAPVDKKLVVSDLSNIEGRVLVWLAREDWKLQAFRNLDASIRADLYKLAYARAFNISPDDVDKSMRQIGKVMELGLGFGGGVAAFVTFVLVYGLDLQDLADAALQNSSMKRKFGGVPLYSKRKPTDSANMRIRHMRFTKTPMAKGAP